MGNPFEKIAGDNDEESILQTIIQLYPGLTPKEALFKAVSQNAITKEEAWRSSQELRAMEEQEKERARMVEAARAHQERVQEESRLRAAQRRRRNEANRAIDKEVNEARACVAAVARTLPAGAVAGVARYGRVDVGFTTAAKAQTWLDEHKNDFSGWLVSGNGETHKWPDSNAVRVSEAGLEHVIRLYPRSSP